MNPGLLKFLFFFFIFFYQSVALSSPIEGQIVHIRILDKITSKVDTIEIKVSDSLNYGSLTIEIFSCFKNPPEEIPEDYVLLKIFDKLNSEHERKIYQGWMIKSSPDSTPLEHPIYDVWVKDCKIIDEF